MIYDSFLNNAVKNMSDSIPVNKLMGINSSQIQQPATPLMSFANNAPGSSSLSPAPIGPLQATQPSFLSFLNPNNMGDAGLPGLGFQMPNFGGLFSPSSIYSGISALPTSNGNSVPSSTSTGGSDQSGPPAAATNPPPASSTPGTSTQAPSTPSATGNGIVDAAMRQQGKPYVWGGTGVNGGGFDCSGLTQWAYAQNGINLPRTAQEQYNATQRVSQQDLKPGDLVFYANTYSDPSGPITHVGIYIGNGQMVNAPVEGKPVQVINMNQPYWQQHFAGGGRV